MYEPSGNGGKERATMGKEQEPKGYAFSLEINGNRFICTPDNTYGYLYQNTDYDHVFIKTGEDEGSMYGYHIFRHLMGDQFDKMLKKMIKNGFEVFSEEEPSEADLDAYQRSIPKEFTVPYPDTEWGNTKQMKAENWGKFAAYLLEQIANGEIEE